MLELVEGDTLAERLHPGPLEVEEALGIARQIAEGLEAAHDNGIIHRDLKPANILVTEEGDPRVLDFGLSKLLDVSEGQAHRDQTVALIRAWTPQYASPEQARGESCTTATDIYSLGVLLFETLTGHRPYRFENETPYQVERILCEEQCPTPSRVVTRVARVPRSDGGTRAITPESVSRARSEPLTRLRKRLRGDLDTIILKALQKDARRRYLSVELFSQDLARHLDGQPVLARGDGMSYQASKFVRRHRWAVGGAAVVVLSLVMGVVLATVGLAREATARRKADIAAARATQANEFLEEMLSSADPGRDGREVRVVEVLDQAAQRVAHAFAEQPEIESSLRGTIGVSYRALGLYDASGPHLEASLRLARSAHDPKDRLVLEAMNELALLYWAQGRMDEAQPLLKQALDTQREQSGDEDSFTLTLNNNLAGLFMQRGQLAEAEPLFRRTIEVQRQTLGAYHADTLRSMSNLAMLLRQQNRLDEAEELFQLVYRERERMLGQMHPDTIVSINNLSAVLFSRGSYEEATEMSRQVLDLQRSVNGPRHPHTLIAMSNLGALLRHAGDLDAAESLLKETLALTIEVLGADHPETLKTRHGMVSVYRDQGRLEEAMSLAREVVEVSQRVLPEQHWRTALHRLLLAQLEIDLNNLDGVEEDLESTYETLREQLGSEHPHTFEAVATLVRYYEATDQAVPADEYRSLMPLPAGETPDTAASPPAPDGSPG
ncbi:MAG: serine/threonine protein kinase [Planctomycetes bacterium]|nr:serine/threonine protein kinase [Planctomycetota bacterium]